MLRTWPLWRWRRRPFVNALSEANDQLDRIQLYPVFHLKKKGRDAEYDREEQEATEWLLTPIGEEDVEGVSPRLYLCYLVADHDAASSMMLYRETYFPDVWELRAVQLRVILSIEKARERAIAEEKQRGGGR